MMSKQILIIQGHPDASQPHLCHALASSSNVGAPGIATSDASSSTAVGGAS